MMRTITVLSILAVSSLAFAASAPAQEAKKLFFEGDMVRGAQAGAPGPLCALNNQFKHLEKVVWRVRVLDENGKSLDDKGIKSLTVQLPDGQKFPARYSQHPPPQAGPAADYFWSAVWIIPPTYPSGTLSYKLVATGNDGKEQTWEPFKTKPSLLTVVDGEIELKKPQ